MTTNAIRHTRETPTSETLALLEGEFEQAWREGWQIARRSCDLSREQAGTIDDLSRLRGCLTLKRGFEILRHTSKNATDATALMEKLRGYLLAGHAIDLTEAEATHRETLANYHGNDAQDRHHFYRSAGTRSAVVEAMNGQAIASRLLADTLLKERPALIKAGR